MNKVLMSKRSVSNTEISLLSSQMSTEDGKKEEVWKTHPKKISF